MTHTLKRQIVTGLAALLGVVGLTASAAPARAQATPTFRLFASHSGRALIANPELNAAVTQQTSIGGPSDVWFLRNGQLVHNQSGLCMQPESSSSGARIKLQKCFTGDPTDPNQPPQFWTLRQKNINGQKLFLIQNKQTKLVLDIKNASTDNGAELVQFDINNGPNQHFERRFL